MMFLGTEGRLACVCVFAFRPTTDPRHRHARTCAMTARCACKKRTRRACHRRSRRVSSFVAVRVGEATHPGLLSAKHLRCPHCPTWPSHRSSLRNHILRFHEPPPPTSSPVLSESSFSEADAVEEGKRGRQRGPRSREARQRRLGRGEPNTTGHEEFTILHSNVRGFILRVAELSARLRVMESKPSVLCLTETLADIGLPSLRIEGYTLISRRDRDDGRLGGGVAVFALEKLAHRVTLVENSHVAERSWVIMHYDHGSCVIGCWYRPPAPGEADSTRSFKEEAQLHATNAVGMCSVG